MSGPCCTPSSAYGRFFNRSVARVWLRRYRRRGLPGSARGLVALAGDVGGETVLEVGGGLGTIGLELLGAGASRATNVELSDGFEEAAAELLAETGRADLVERRVADFVLVADELPQHDVVVLHRVVCCYPDADALVAASASRAGRELLLTYPRERPFLHAGFGLVNAWLRLRRCALRVYVHPFAAMAAAAEREGVTLTAREPQDMVWENAAFARLPDAAGGNSTGMEPRHRESEAEQLAAEHAADAAEEPRERRGQEDVRIEDDDQRHDATPEEEVQI